MKKSVIITSVLAAALCAEIYAFDTDTSLKLTGSVSEYTKTEYTITEKFGDYYRSPKAKYVHIFDAAGKETESSELTSKDALVDHIAYSYNAAGSLDSQVCTDVDGKIQWKITYAYDAAGNKTEESEFNASDSLVNKTIWKITPGKQAEESFYNADGALLSKIITKYDDQGRISEVATYRAEGNLEEKASYSYNDAGKLSEVAYANGFEAVIKKTVFRFDASYQITEEQTYNADNKLVVRVIYKYDASGNITKKTTYNVAEKFGTTVNELAGISEYTYGNAPKPVSAGASAGSAAVNAK